METIKTPEEYVISLINGNCVLIVDFEQGNTGWDNALNTEIYWLEVPYPVFGPYTTVY